MDMSLCMGASLSIGHGIQQVVDMQSDTDKRVIAFLGDSTFFHTGVNSLINTAYNGSRTINVILDNRITGMTGHQQNPGTGFTLQGREAKELDIEQLVRACGIEHVFIINPNKIDEVKKTLDEALVIDAASVIITRWPCVLKKLSAQDKEEFKDVFQSKCAVDVEACIGCKVCTHTGCPSISYDKGAKKASIEKTSCVGCEVCVQVCPVNAISKEGN
jgi:indolepyruvate ferredoxin oxidoreductase alpha subunit